MKRQTVMTLLPFTLIAALTATGAAAREVNMEVPVEHRANNPCTNNTILIRGQIGVDGNFKKVEEGYRFQGRLDYSELKAVAEEKEKIFQAAPVSGDEIVKTVDFPVDTTISQDVAFQGPGDDLLGDMTARINVGIFRRSVKIESVELRCQNERVNPPTAQPQS